MIERFGKDKMVSIPGIDSFEVQGNRLLIFMLRYVRRTLLSNRQQKGALWNEKTAGGGTSFRERNF